MEPQTLKAPYRHEHAQLRTGRTRTTCSCSRLIKYSSSNDSPVDSPSLDKFVKHSALTGEREKRQKFFHVLVFEYEIKFELFIYKHKLLWPFSIRVYGVLPVPYTQYYFTFTKILLSQLAKARQNCSASDYYYYYYYYLRYYCHYLFFSSRLIFPDKSDFMHQTCLAIITSRDTYSEAGETWREITLKFLYEVSFCHTSKGSLTCRKILWRGADGFTSPSRECEGILVCADYRACSCLYAALRIGQPPIDQIVCLMRCPRFSTTSLLRSAHYIGISPGRLGKIKPKFPARLWFL
jgi:hypothetical protein